MRPADVVLTRHALARYAELVRPDLPESEARAELRQRARRGRLRRRRPPWLGPMPRPAHPAGFLELPGEPLAVLLLVHNADSGDTVATTTKVRDSGGVR